MMIHSCTSIDSTHSLKFHGPKYLTRCIISVPATIWERLKWLKFSLRITNRIKFNGFCRTVVYLPWWYPEPHTHDISNVCSQGDYLNIHYLVISTQKLTLNVNRSEMKFPEHFMMLFSFQNVTSIWCISSHHWKHFGMKQEILFRIF